MARRVFISYRRADTAAVAGRFYDRLCRSIQRRHIFFDVSSVVGGEDFVERIAGAIQNSDIVVAFIGAHWMKTRAGSPAAAWDEDDYVRVELQLALQNQRVLLPVLVDGVDFPPANQLPEDIRPICLKNAVTLRHESFVADADRIIAIITGRGGDDGSKNRLVQSITLALSMVAGALVGFTAATVIGLVHHWIAERPLSANIGEAATWLLLTLCVAAGASLGAHWALRRARRFSS